jgi:hypothetical protein
LLTTIPPSRSPTKVMNSPMPTPIDSFNASGTARTTDSRSPASTSTTATTPSITTHAIPTGHPSSLPRIRSNATIALMPNPDASANGTFANTPIAIENTAAARAVATATASNGSPAADRIAGLTNRMYAIVRKVVSPPSASTRRVVPRSESVNQRSSRSAMRRRAP